MEHWFYITPEEYAKAEEIGIKPAMLDRRIRAQGWTKQKALTTPPRKITNRAAWWAVAKQNGLKYDTFMNRVKSGWSEE